MTESTRFVRLNAQLSTLQWASAGGDLLLARVMSVERLPRSQGSMRLSRGDNLNEQSATDEEARTSDVMITIESGSGLAPSPSSPAPPPSPPPTPPPPRTSPPPPTLPTPSGKMSSSSPLRNVGKWARALLRRDSEDVHWLRVTYRRLGRELETLDLGIARYEISAHWLAGLQLAVAADQAHSPLGDLRHWLCDVMREADVDRCGMIRTDPLLPPHLRPQLRRLAPPAFQPVLAPGSWLRYEASRQVARHTHAPFELLLDALNVSPELGNASLAALTGFAPTFANKQSLSFALVERLACCALELASPLTPLFSSYAHALGASPGAAPSAPDGRGGLWLSLGGWLRFNREEQSMGEEGVAAATELFEQVAGECRQDARLCREHEHALYLSPFGFGRLLLHSSNAALDAAALRVDEDASLPLSSYWIASSHNTYLVADQLFGRSDADMYRRVLLSGCRCIEIDLWDGTDGEPDVWHGNTLVTRIRLAAVAAAIAECAFVASSLPLIISLEMHCSPPQQTRIAQILHEHLWEAILLQGEAERYDDVPIGELRNRIILKGKNQAKGMGDASASPAGSPTARFESAAACSVRAQEDDGGAVTGAVGGGASSEGASSSSATPRDARAAAPLWLGSSWHSSQWHDVEAEEALEQLIEEEDEMEDAKALEALGWLGSGEHGVVQSVVRSVFGWWRGSESVQPAGSSRGAASSRRSSITPPELAATPPQQQQERQREAQLDRCISTMLFSDESQRSEKGIIISLRSEAARPPEATPGHTVPDARRGGAEAPHLSSKREPSTRASPRAISEAPLEAAPSAAPTRRQRMLGRVKRLTLRIAKPSKRQRKQKKRVVEELFALYGMRGVPVDHLATRKRPAFPFAVTSITERVCNRAAAGSADLISAWQAQLQLQLARLYPRATRVASDNYDPLPAWRLGVQMAALNYQTNDLPMQLNRAFFARGGGTGYVPKPIELRTSALRRRLPPQAPLDAADPTAAVNTAAATATSAATAIAAASARASAAATEGSGRSEGGGDAATPPWPLPRAELCLLSLRLIAVYHLPTLGEHRPCNFGPMDTCVPELSGVPTPPTGAVVAAPSVSVSVHPLGGFGAVAADVDTLKRSGSRSFGHRLNLPSKGGATGLIATFDAPAHCLLAEPWEALLRVAVLHAGEVELAYEAVVAGALRTGYRCLPLREPASGSLIDGCALLMHIERSAAPQAWVADHDELRETIGSQAATIHAQREALNEQAKEIERLQGLLGSRT